jgi:hypothetical protein
MWERREIRVSPVKAKQSYWRCKDCCVCKSDRGEGSGKPSTLKLSTCSVAGTTTGALATPETPSGEAGEVHKRTAREAMPRCAGPRT